MPLTLKDMADHVCELTGLLDADSKAIARTFLRRRYEMVYDSQLWEDSKTAVTLATASAEVVLPNWVDKVLAVKTAGANPIYLAPEAIETIWRTNASAYDEEGDSVVYTELPPVATHTHPGGARVELNSSSASDFGAVRLRGLHNGLECEETVVLTGATPAVSVNYYDELLHLSKAATIGAVHAVAQANGAILAHEVQILLAADTERRHPRIRLHRAFTDPLLYLQVLAKRRAIPLRHDNDTVALSGAENLLIAYAVSDMWERLRQVAKAQVKLQEAAGLMAALMSRELTQRVRATRLVPETQSYAGEI